MFTRPQAMSAATQPRHLAAVVSSLGSAAPSRAALRGEACGRFHSHRSTSTASTSVATSAAASARHHTARTFAAAHKFTFIGLLPFAVDGLKSLFFARSASIRTVPKISEGL